MAAVEPAASRSSRPPHADDRAGECTGPDILVPADLWICRPGRRNRDVRCSARRIRAALLGAGGLLTSDPRGPLPFTRRVSQVKEAVKASALNSFGGTILHLAKRLPRTIALGWMLVLAMHAKAGAQEPAGNPSVMCERA